MAWCTNSDNGVHVFLWPCVLTVITVYRFSCGLVYYSGEVLTVCRFSCGLVYYILSFGVEQLSGNLYLNMFLLSVVEIPGMLVTTILNNRYRTLNLASWLPAWLGG